MAAGWSGVAQNLRRPGSRIVTIALLGAAGALLLALIYWQLLLVQLPSLEQLREAGFDRPSVVYAADGEPIGNFGDRFQEWVQLNEISPRVVEALIATEDHRFWDHWGIDARRTVGSVLQTLRGERQGGSTITMQLARNAFPDLYGDTPLTRKIKEWVTALRFEAVYGKSEILEMYLNAVPYMYNATGIEAAARTYFQKSASTLKLDEAAMLVGMLKGTSYYNPVRHPERALERRNVVLQQMLEHGYLAEATYREIKNVPTTLHFSRSSRNENIAPHFVEHVRAWLSDWAKSSNVKLESGGLRIYTTIDRRLQRAAKEAVLEVTDDLQAVADVEWSAASPPHSASDPDVYREFRTRVEPFSYFWKDNDELLETLIRESDRFEKLSQQGASASETFRALRADRVFVDSLKESRQRIEAGFVAIIPKNGHVVAWIGARDFARNQFDHVADAMRQPGSTFKPFVYGAALENGYRPSDRLKDEVMEYTDPETQKTWRPENVGSATGERISLRDALAHSKNTITAQLVADLGPETVIDFARKAGIRSELSPYLSIGLGTSEVSLLELTTAYSTIANEGRQRPPLFVTRIEDRNGRILDRFSSEEIEALSVWTAQQLFNMLEGVVDYGTAAPIRTRYRASGKLAGKTGTSQDGADGWFVLLAPEIVVGSWVGFDLPAITFRSEHWEQGAHTALPIVGRFYQSVNDRVNRSGLPGHVGSD